MTFWLLAAFLLLLTLFGTVWPLLSRGPRRADATDVQIYKDQLLEIDRDIDRGTVERRDGEASRVEISRRLLRAAQNQRAAQGTSLRVARIAAIGLLVALPVASILAYSQLGSPQVPDMPLQARVNVNPATVVGSQQNADDNGELKDLVARVEAHLRQKPDDGEGWLVIAPVYVRLGQIDDAVMAYEKALQLTPKTSALWSAFGEVSVMQASGRITEKARNAFEQARKLEPDSIKPRFYLALALSQERRLVEAAEAWTNLLEGAPEDAPWTRIARAQLSQAQAGLSISEGRASGGSGGGMGATGGAAATVQRPGVDLPGPDQADIEAAQDLPSGDRAAFINSMVTRLQGRLDADGGTVDEWIRLVRAYAVLGKSDEAVSAYRKGRAAFVGDDSAQALLDDSAAGLGIPTNGNK